MSQNYVPKYCIKGHEQIFCVPLVPTCFILPVSYFFSKVSLYFFMLTLRYLDKTIENSSDQDYFYKSSFDLILLNSKLDNPRDVEADTRYHAQQDRSLRSSSTMYCLLMSSTPKPSLKIGTAKRHLLELSWPI